jgi:nucleoside-diphosphate-sugar epimerase
LEHFEKINRSGTIHGMFDVIYDMAAYGNLASQTQFPKQVYEANLMRVINTVNTMGNAKLIYMSTSSVLLPVQTFYSASKKACEEYLKITDKPIAIVRPFTVIGDREHHEHLIPQLIESCFTGKKMPFVPKPVHDFIDVEDLVDALLIIAKKGQFKGEVYEVGTGHETSNEEILKVVEKISGRKANLEIVDSMREYDNKSWRANPERIISLGWKPKRSLEDTIGRMYKYETERLEANHY